MFTLYALMKASMIVLAGIVVLGILFGEAGFFGCIIGGHTWFTSTTSFTYGRTGPLPDEIHSHSGPGGHDFRYERHCLECDRLEYKTCDGDWLEFKLPPGEAWYGKSID